MYNNKVYFSLINLFLYIEMGENNKNTYIFLNYFQELKKQIIHKMRKKFKYFLKNRLKIQIIILIARKI